MASLKINDDIEVLYMGAKRFDNYLNKHDRESFCKDQNNIKGAIQIFKILGEISIKTPPKDRLENSNVPWDYLMEIGKSIEAGQVPEPEVLWTMMEEVAPKILKALAILIPSEDRSFI